VAVREEIDALKAEIQGVLGKTESTQILERLKAEVLAVISKEENQQAILTLRTEIFNAITGSKTLQDLDQVRVRTLGKLGILTAYLGSIGSLPQGERAFVGKTANEMRVAVEAALEARKAELSAFEMAARIDASAVDVTLPGRAQQMGTRHLISRITDEVAEIFLGIGYSVAQGPEVETDYYNFEALNAPPDHPSRGLADTFYVRDLSGAAAAVTGESDVLLRTQTSGVQVRVMEQQKPPIYVIVPGKVYRRDVADPSHLPQFTQIEGLVVDKGITFGDLKGTLDYFCKQMFGQDRKTRVRAHYFPFTEPSAEVDVSCGICQGEGCRFCKGTGWLEIMGCGMVDPNVFGYVGIDAQEYTGFAFGMGVERIACLKYNVPDLRMLVEGDMRFLRQF
jgi:phenylalanyl-tRNA synthetase alpha chain